MAQRKETVLDLAKFIDKGVHVKLSGGREGARPGRDQLRRKQAAALRCSAAHTHAPRTQLAPVPCDGTLQHPGRHAQWLGSCESAAVALEGQTLAAALTRPNAAAAQ